MNLTLKVFSLFSLYHLASAGPAKPPKGEATIQWGPCERNFTNKAIVCGSLDVPLDYSNRSSTATLTLELLKIPANPSEKKKGTKSIIFNFGGPGADGTADFNFFGDFLSVLTGGEHDLLTFVPRGTGNTIKFSCSSTASPGAPGSALGYLSGNSSDVALGTIWAQSKLYVDECYDNQTPEMMGLIGTAFVVRDMMKIVDALKEDGLLRYWGMSYGTILGATAAAMFPDRMDKVLLDAVGNPHEYYNEFETELLSSADDVFSGFIAGCVKAPANCLLAATYPDLTAPQLEEKVYAYLDALKYNPIPIQIPGVPGFLIDYSIVRSLTHSFLYQPKIWPTLGMLYYALVSNDIATLTIFATNLLTNPPGEGGISVDSMRGIKCGDSLARAQQLSDVLPAIRKRHSISRIAGDVADFVLTDCARWRVPAREVYKGNFRVKTKNPMLVVNARYDPVTPLVSARNVTAGFKDSVLLEWNGYGHAIYVQGSTCVAKAVQEYFTKGKLPKKGTVCEVEGELFSGDDNWGPILEKLGGGKKLGKRDMPVFGGLGSIALPRL